MKYMLYPVAWVFMVIVAVLIFIQSLNLLVSTGTLIGEKWHEHDSRESTLHTPKNRDTEL